MNPGNTKSIGLLTSFSPEVFRSEYFTRIIAGIVDALRETKYDLKLIMVKDEEYADPSPQILEEHEINGLIILTWRIHPRYIQEAMQGSDLPVVVINDYVQGLRTNIVHCDNRPGTDLAVRHLIAKGYKKIGMLQGPDEASRDSSRRFELWKEFIDQYGLSFDMRHYRKCDYFFEEDGYLKMLDIIQNSDNLPRAMLCFNDDIAIGAIRALRESGIHCPREVAVMGYDGIEKGKYIEPPLTTIRQPLERMGREMVDILLGLIEGKVKGPVHKVYVPELVIRQSC